MAETDSAVDTAAPSEDSQPTEPQMGDGLFEDFNAPVETPPDDTLLGAPSDDARPSEDASQPEEINFDPSSVDILRVDVSTIPEDQRALVLNAQTRMRDIQGMGERQSNELAQKVKALEQAQQAAMVERTVDSRLAGLQEQDEFSNLTPQQRQALDTVDQRIEAKIADLRALTARFEQVEQQVNSINTTQQQGQQNAIQQEINVARAQYGNDLDVYTQQIVALKNTANPRTGQAYTVTEAYEMVSGKASQLSANMTNANHVVRNGTKQQIAPSITSAPAEANGEGGPLTSQELRQGLASLGFEE